MRTMRFYVILKSYKPELIFALNHEHKYSKRFSRNFEFGAKMFQGKTSLVAALNQMVNFDPSLRGKYPCSDATQGPKPVFLKIRDHFFF